MNVEKLRQSSQFRLLSIINAIAPEIPKDLVIDELCMKQLDLIAGATLLRKNGVDKMFKLSPSVPQWKNSTRLYLIPAIYSCAEMVASQIMQTSSATKTFQYHIIVVPKALYLIQSLFESFGVLDSAVLHSYSWDFIPLDSTLLSLEFPHFLKSVFIKGDHSLLGSVAKSLLSFECLYGRFPCVTTLGEKSHKVHSLLESWHNEVRPAFPSESEFSHLIIIDRTIDLASVLLTQLTYEGVLDENFRIQSGFVYLNIDGAEEPQRVMINSNKDEIYAEIKGKHISAVFKHLSQKAKELQELKSKKNTDSIEEIKHFVAHDLKKIQSQQKSLALHISACESVMKKQSGLLEERLNLEQDVMADNRMKDYLSFLEDSMARQFDIGAVLRLMCLYSLMQDGFSEKEFTFFHKQFLQAYGYGYMPCLNDLQHLGLFTSRKLNLEPLLPDKLTRAAHHLPTTMLKSMAFRKICQRLHLLSLDGSSIDCKNGEHPSYVFGGAYTPLIYALVKKCVEDKEPSLEEFARCFGNVLRTNGYNNPEWLSRGKVLVCFIGGATLAEVASLDLLSRQKARQIVIASTSTISGPSFVESLMSSNN